MELTDLRETAALARINMSEDDLEKTFPAFEQMLSFFAILQRGTSILSDLGAGLKDSDNTGEQAGFTVVTSCLRPDTAPLREEDLFESMLSQAPERDGRFIVIPNVL